MQRSIGFALGKRMRCETIGSAMSTHKQNYQAKLSELCLAKQVLI